MEFIEWFYKTMETFRVNASMTMTSWAADKKTSLNKIEKKAWFQQCVLSLLSLWLWRLKSCINIHHLWIEIPFGFISIWKEHFMQREEKSP